MYQGARSQRNKFGEKARNQQKRGRGQSINHSDARVLSSRGYVKIMALHGIFLNRASDGKVNPLKITGHSRRETIKILKGND